MENLDHIVGGALYDFMGFLTTREEELILSSHHDACPAVAVIQEFMNMRGMDLEIPPAVKDWQYRCSCLHLKEGKSSDPLSEEAQADTRGGEKNVAERQIDAGSMSAADMVKVLSGNCGTYYLSDGSGWLLPKNHWLYEDKENLVPRPVFNSMYLLTEEEKREVREQVVNAARYAVRTATANGKKLDFFDPDALVQNLMLAVFGSGGSCEKREAK